MKTLKLYLLKSNSDINKELLETLTDKLPKLIKNRYSFDIELRKADKTQYPRLTFENKQYIGKSQILAFVNDILKKASREQSELITNDEFKGYQLRGLYTDDDNDKGIGDEMDGVDIQKQMSKFNARRGINTKPAEQDSDSEDTPTKKPKKQKPQKKGGGSPLKGKVKEKSSDKEISASFAAIKQDRNPDDELMENFFAAHEETKLDY